MQQPPNLCCFCYRWRCCACWFCFASAPSLKSSSRTLLLRLLLRRHRLVPLFLSCATHQFSLSSHSLLAREQNHFLIHFAHHFSLKPVVACIADTPLLHTTLAGLPQRVRPLIRYLQRILYLDLTLLLRPCISGLPCACQHHFELT